MTTAIQAGEKPEIEYPDDDGEPMADNTLQFKWIVLIEENLESGLSRMIPTCSWRATCCGIRWRVSQPSGPHRMPWSLWGDRKGRRGSYKQWEEGQYRASGGLRDPLPGNRPPEMERKFKFYEQYGVEEYYIYDPDDGTFEGWLRRGSRAGQGQERVRIRQPSVLRFDSSRAKGPDNLKIFGPDGELFQRLSPRSSIERNAAEKRRRSERQRADRLAAKLRDLGFEPD